MQDEARILESPGGTPEKPETGIRNSHPVRRTGGRDAEPLLVEQAWLVIEGAVLFRRERGILARI